MKGGQNLAYKLRGASLGQQTTTDSSERLPRFIVDAVTSLLSYIDSDYRYRFANRAYYNWFGTTPNDVIGRTMAEVLGEEAFQSLKPYADRALAGELVEFESSTPYRTGSRFIRANYSPEIVDGKVLGFAVKVMDITRQKHLETELRQAKESLTRQAAELAALNAETQAAADEALSRFQVLADYTPVLIWMADSENRGTWFNKHWLDFVGRTMEQELGYGWAENIHPDDTESAVNTCGTAIQRREPFAMQLRMKRFDGEYRWMLDQGVPIFDSENAFAGYIGSVIDVTEQRQAADRLKRMNEWLEREVERRTTELKAANHELEGFTYSVSHDLRAPLRSIVATSKILLADLGEELSEDHASLLNRQAANANKLAELIDHLLRLSRLGRQDLVLRDVDLTETAHEIAQELCASYPDISISVQDGLRTLADPAMSRLVLFNLMENAAKFSPAGGTIEVGSTEDGRFFVRDHGVGFDMAYAEKLFQPFERLHRPDEFPGSGVGLANVHRILARHGGAITAESSPGAGSTFYFHFGGAEAESDPLPEIRSISG